MSQDRAGKPKQSARVRESEEPEFRIQKTEPADGAEHRQALRENSADCQNTVRLTEQCSAHARK